MKSIQNQVEKITDIQTQKTVSTLHNLVENLASNNISLSEENQTLKDEINRLKGEQGKPDFKPSKKKTVISLQKTNEKKQRNLLIKKNRKVLN